jgi:hypothetical protein
MGWSVKALNASAKLDCEEMENFRILVCSQCEEFTFLFLRKTQFSFAENREKIAENFDHNIDPWPPFAHHLISSIFPNENVHIGGEHVRVGRVDVQAGVDFMRLFRPEFTEKTLK